MGYAICATKQPDLSPSAIYGGSTAHRLFCRHDDPSANPRLSLQLDIRQKDSFRENRCNPCCPCPKESFKK
jgi:hypothetical protein